MPRMDAYTQWNLPEGAAARLGKGWLSDIAYSPDGELMAVCADAGAWIYDAKTYAERNLLNRSALAASFAPDGRTLVLAGPDEPELWDAYTGEMITTFEESPDSLIYAAYSPDGSFVAGACYDHTARI